MRIIILTIFIAAAFNLQAQKNLWLIAGQSNASGMGDRRTSYKYISDACFDYVQKGDSLRILKDPAGEDNHYFGKANSGSIAPSFAWHLHKMTGDTVIVVSAGRGGSSCHANAETLYGTWATTGTLKIFDACIEKVKMAESKIGCKIKGILWLQGERDANAINDKKLTEKQYEEGLKSLISRFRNSLGDKNLPFYIVLTGQYINHPEEGFLTVRHAQRKVIREDPRVFLAPVDPWIFPDMEWMTDEIHYTQNAYNRIGAALAQEVAETNQ
jgi:hypothetical protein